MLFEIGCGRLVLEGNADAVLKELQDKAVKAARKRHEEALSDEQEASEHTQVQHVLIRIGRALNYDVFVARNDRHRVCHGDDFSLLTLPQLPELGLSPEVRETVELIDVLWLEPKQCRIACGFEIEQSTSIYSGILRMKDLALSLQERSGHFYLVAPESREQEVMAQMSRPALHSAACEFQLGYLPAGELKQQCDAICRFGVDRSVLLKIAKAHKLTPVANGAGQ
jgi:type II restriction enzyme